MKIYNYIIKTMNCNKNKKYFNIIHVRIYKIKSKNNRYPY